MKRTKHYQKPRHRTPTSHKSKWALSAISHYLEAEKKDCTCSLLDWRNKEADWMMCPECGRIWVRKGEHWV